MKKLAIAAWSAVLLGVTGAIIFSTTETHEAISKLDVGGHLLSGDGSTNSAADLRSTDPQGKRVEATSAPKPPVSKSALVETLSKSGSPIDAFAAYKLIRECVTSRRIETEVAQDPDPARRAKAIPPAVACEDISPGQIVGRLELLDAAAAAGVHGAALAFGLEGPDGYGVRESGDPRDASTAEWARRLTAQIEAGVKTGDRWSLMTMSNRYENGADVEKDMSKALSYWVAMVELERARTGEVPSKAQNTLNRLKRTLTPEQADAATKYGEQLAVSAQPAR